MQDLRTKRHVVHSLHMHLVFVTKYRKKVFSPFMIERLKNHLKRVCNICKSITGKEVYCHRAISLLPVVVIRWILSNNTSKISKFVLTSHP